MVRVSCLLKIQTQLIFALSKKNKIQLIYELKTIIEPKIEITYLSLWYLDTNEKDNNSDSLYIF